jgi:hypothetical protein
MTTTADLLKFAEATRKIADTYGRDEIVKAAAVAKTAYETAGRSGSRAHLLFHGILSEPVVTDFQRKVASVVFQCLGRQAEVRAFHEKLANSGPVMLAGIKQLLQRGANAAGAGLSVYGNTIKALAGAGALTGAVAGTGAWGLQRALGKEDQKSRKLELQRDSYSQLAREIDKELELRGLVKNPSTTAAAYDYLT